MYYTKHLNTLLAILFFFGFQGNILSQNDTGINYSFPGTSLREALQVLINEHNIPVLYINTEIEDISVSAECQNCQPKDALNNLLEGTPLQWKQIKNQFILYNSSTGNLHTGPTEGNSENRNLKGFITDSINDIPLPYATILIEGTNKGVTSDENGYFELNLPADKYALNIMYVGYNPDTLIADLTLPGKTKARLIKLDPTNYNLDAVVIKTSKIHALDVDQDATTLTLEPEKIKQIATLNPGDLNQNIRITPGVSGVNDNLSGFNIRGGSPDQTLVIFDGIPLYHAQHLMGFNSAFNANSVEKISLHSGGFSARYGDRLSGILELQGKSGNNEKLHYGITADFFNLSGYLDLPVSKKINLYTNYTKSIDVLQQKEKITDRNDHAFFNQYDNIYASSEPKAGYNLDAYGSSSPQAQQRFSEYQDLSAKLKYSGKKDTTSLSVIFGTDEINIDATLAPTENKTGVRNERWNNLGLGYHYKREWRPDFHSVFSAAYSDYSNQTRFDYQYLNSSQEDSITTSYENNNTINHLRLAAENFIRFSHFYRLKLGIEYSRVKTMAERTFMSNDSVMYNLFDNDKTNNKYITFIENDLTLLKKSDIQLGLRVIHHDFTHAINFMPRAGIKHRLTNNITLSYNWGVFYQYMHRTPSVIFFNVSSFGSSNTWVNAQEDLRPSRSTHHIAGIGFKFKKYAANISTYYKKYYNLSFLTPTKTDFIGIDNEYPRLTQSIYLDWTLDHKYISNGNDKSDILIGDGYSQGLEIFLSKSKGIHTGFISYHWGTTRYRFPYMNNGKEFTSPDSREHELTIMNQIGYRNWHFGLTYLIASGKNYPASYYTNNYSQNNILYLRHPVSWEISNMKKLPAYHRMDASLRKSWDNLLFFSGSVGLSVYNVLAINNIISKYYESESDEDFTPVKNSELKNQYDTGRMLNLFVEINF